MVASPITSVEHLIQTLSTCTGRDFLQVVRHLDIPSEEFEPYMFWEDSHYTRNCLKCTDQYELVLLCWEPGQETPIHCHDEQECWVHLVQGSVKEKRFQLEEGTGIPKLVQTGTSEEGSFTYMNDEMGVHKLINVHAGRSMSLHLYVKPIEKCRIYDPETGELEVRHLVYHSLEGKLVEPVSS